jgi:hypothetical protein
MQILFDLIHSLAREEKRLYHIHKREGRFQGIYEGYLKAQAFAKPLDHQLYAEHFADVSRAFYSMQKRALMDDILAVLQEHSNSQHPGYQFIRAYGKANVLLQRRMGEAAALYSQEAYDTAMEAGHSGNAALAVRAQQQALLLTPNPSLAAYEALREREIELSQPTPQQRLAQLRERLTLHSLHTDEQTPEATALAATELEAALNDITFETHDLDLFLDKLGCQGLLFELTGRADAFHRHISQIYQQAAALGIASSQPHYLRLMNMLLHSGLRSGDFLLLTGMIYRLAKEVPSFQEEHRRQFLPDYYETAALFHFYENDLPEALRHIEAVIRHEATPREQFVRCVFYRLAMLVAAHLPIQAKEEIAWYTAQYPELKEESLVWLIEVLVAIDAQNSQPEEIVYQIERYRHALRKRKDCRPQAESLTLLSTFLEKRKIKEKHVPVFPVQWENILRIDLWVKAKQGGRFYYNLLLEDWQTRRKVF